MPNTRPCLLAIPLLLCAIAVFSCTRDSADEKIAFRQTSAGGEPGLQPVDCWFGDHLPSARCYRMWVPEKHGDPESRLINFPLVVFRTPRDQKRPAALLHLGAGGPGAPMSLDEPLALEYMLAVFADLSVNQGRDLIFIDPRGAGLADPRLACGTFVENERRRLRQNLDPREYMLAVAADDEACIDEFLAQGVDFSAYNSFAVAQDIEALRAELYIERWVLYGVSYAANYALTIANEYPDRVESMLLDSAYISKIGWHEYYIDSITRPYRYLFEYCAADSGCNKPVQNLGQRFWALIERLETEPVRLTVELENRRRVEMLLDGDRLNAAIMFAIYEPSIFDDFPAILDALERGVYESLEPFLQAYVSFLLDSSWADISQMAHYCYEDRPGIDFERIEVLIEQLPPGFIRENARVGFDWPDQCDRMHIDEAAPHEIPSRKLETPVLFLHGKLDLVTPVDNVRRIAEWFDTFHLLEYDVGHGVLGNARCAHASSVSFLLDPGADISALDRYCSEGG